MSNAYARLDQALKDLVEAYTEVEAELEDKYSDDEDSFSHAVIEALETAIESTIEEQDISTSALAGVFANMTEALEQLDPSAFDEDEDEYMVDDIGGGMEDIDEMDDDDMDEMDDDE